MINPECFFSMHRHNNTRRQRIVGEHSGLSADLIEITEDYLTWPSIAECIFMIRARRSDVMRYGFDLGRFRDRQKMIKSIFIICFGVGCFAMGMALMNAELNKTSPLPYICAAVFFFASPVLLRAWHGYKRCQLQSQASAITRGMALENQVRYALPHPNDILEILQNEEEQLSMEAEMSTPGLAV